MCSKILWSPLIVSDFLLEFLVKRPQMLRVSSIAASWVRVNGDGLRLDFYFLQVAAANRFRVYRHAEIGKFATANNFKLSST